MIKKLLLSEQELHTVMEWAMSSLWSNPQNACQDDKELLLRMFKEFPRLADRFPYLCRVANSVALSSDEEVLTKAGWVIECESPFEIRHYDGSFASEQAANIVLDALREEAKL